MYDHAWAGPDSTYLLTNSADFNPNASLDGHYTALEPVKN
jgi:hypothetical protein